MSSHPELRLDWCSHAAAKYAVEHWHYSRTMPIGKLVKIGVWEAQSFIGCVLFSTGASPQIHKAFGVSRFQICELVRVALSKHRSPVSRIVRIAMRLLQEQSPKLRLVVSFADPEQGHIGGIYQAGNWLYAGRSTPGLYYEVNGKLTHNRNLEGPIGFITQSSPAVQQRYTQRLREGLRSGSIKRVETQPKYKYLYPLDRDMRRQIEPLAKPYPKRARSVDSDTPANHAGEGGATPTLALQEQAATWGQRD